MINKPFYVRALFAFIIFIANLMAYVLPLSLCVKLYKKFK